MLRGVSMKKICCFTGNRPQGLPWGNDEKDKRCVLLKAKLREEIIKAISDGYNHFISGMSLGIDQYAVEILLDLRKNAKVPPFIIEAAIPCETQSVYWKETARDKYFDLITQIDVETMVSRAYSKSCMHIRNRYMVDQSTRVIAVHNGKKGGTYNTVKYAEQKNIEIVYIKV